ncbi:MAG: hypothetical protein LBU83_07060, partial [Bacteroidales bacterium]|nr:hypothetical protein [Bacteroidales bacterium]
MEIIIKSKNIDFDENILNHVSNLICSFCYQLNFSFDNILQIIFAEEKDYGKEIKKIDPNDNYTNTSTHRGFGKAIYLKDIDKSIIIMRIEILQGIIQIIKSNICDNKLPNLKMDNTQFFIVF